MHPDSIVEETAGILAFDAEERILVDEGLARLAEARPQDADLVSGRFEALEALARAVSRFPSACESQLLRGVRRDGETLAASMCAFSGPSRLLRTPTRVVASRAFLVAKVQAFSMLAIAAEDHPGVSARARAAVMGAVCALLAEDVYLSCLEDPSLPLATREDLARDLLALWERGRDPRASVHAPALASLWSARDASPPVFGTLEGSSELVRLSIELGPDWLRFVADELDDEDARGALEEFLFALTAEEIARARRGLFESGLSSASAADVAAILGPGNGYGSVERDPRSMYEFYVERRERARERAKIGAPGPRKTIEGMYLTYRMVAGA